MLLAAYARVKALEIDLEKNERGLRANADIKAALSLACRDWQIVAAAVRSYDAAKHRRREAWREARRLVKIPACDRVPQR